MSVHQGIVELTYIVVPVILFAWLLPRGAQPGR